MFVYLVTRPGGDETADYDEFGGFVCIADSETSARNTLPCDVDMYRYEWVNTNIVEVTCLGTAAAGLEAGIVLSSYHAG